jgi:hypothetical protein
LIIFLPIALPCLGSPPPKGLFLFAVKKKQKTSAENFSFEASRRAWAVDPEKFVRPISVERGYGAMA